MFDHIGQRGKDFSTKKKGPCISGHHGFNNKLKIKSYANTNPPLNIYNSKGKLTITMYPLRRK